MFSEAPLAAAWSQPYVVALLPGHIEVRSLQDLAQQGLAQVRSSFRAWHAARESPLLGKWVG
jgi:hypothetical protein